MRSHLLQALMGTALLAVLMVAGLAVTPAQASSQVSQLPTRATGHITAVQNGRDYFILRIRGSGFNRPYSWQPVKVTVTVSHSRHIDVSVSFWTDRYGNFDRLIYVPCRVHHVWHVVVISSLYASTSIPFLRP